MRCQVVPSYLADTPARAQTSRFLVLVYVLRSYRNKIDRGIAHERDASNLFSGYSGRNYSWNFDGT